MVFANLTVLENLMMGAYLQRDRAVVCRELELVYATFPRLQERAAQVAGLDRTDFILALAREGVDAFAVDMTSLRRELADG